MRKVKVVFDKVSKGNHVECDFYKFSEEDVQALTGIDSFHMDRKDVDIMVSKVKPIMDGSPILVDICEIYSNGERSHLYRLEPTDKASVSTIYGFVQQNRLDYNTKTGEAVVKFDNEEDIMQKTFPGIDFKVYPKETEFVINGEFSYMLVNFSFSGVIFVFDAEDGNIFDGWEEVPDKVTGLPRYPLGFRKSKLPFDMAKYGNELIVRGDSTIEARCPLPTVAKDLVIKGDGANARLTLIATDKMQPAIGVVTHTDMSYGRWCPGYNGLATSITVQDGIEVSLQSLVDNFTIGRYGTNDIPVLHVEKGSVMNAPEMKGFRNMEDKVERYAGSTKWLGYCEYYYS